MNKLILSTLCSLVTLVGIDSIWLTIISKNFYMTHLKDLLAHNIQFVPIVLFYILYAFGITIFVVLPALEGNFNCIKTFCLGAFLGLVAYGAYDFTNQATLQNWPIILTVVDLAWGTFLTGTTAMITTYVMRYLLV